MVNRSFVRALALFVGILFWPLSGGCRPLVDELRGPPFPKDHAAETLRALRSNEPSEKPFGFSQKAREIERDFGFQ